MSTSIQQWWQKRKENGILYVCVAQTNNDDDDVDLFKYFRLYIYKQQWCTMFNSFLFLFLYLPIWVYDYRFTYNIYVIDVFHTYISTRQDYNITIQSI